MSNKYFSSTNKWPRSTPIWYNFWNGIHPSQVKTNAGVTKIKIPESIKNIATPEKKHKERIKSWYDNLAGDDAKWKNKNWHYHESVKNHIDFLLKRDATILAIGSEIGYLLNGLKPKRGLGIDLSPKMIEAAQKAHPDLEFIEGDAEDLPTNETFDYVILSDVVGDLFDVQKAFGELKKVTRPDSRVIITYYNYLWEPVIKFAEALGLKRKLPVQNWLPSGDIENLLELNDFEVIRKIRKMIFPFHIPLLSTLLNKYLGNLPLIRKLSLIQILVAKRRGQPLDPTTYSVSVVIPAKNERGNIEAAIKRTPTLGKHMEIIFVEGNSGDETCQEIERVIKAYPERDIKLIHQGEGKGKGDAVRKGFAMAQGDVLMILDADLTMPPEELPKFFNTLMAGKGEFINGSRLVYQMEKQAMRFLNLLANKFFGMMFTYLLEQRFRDTLCGTKVLFRQDYEKIVAGRSFFGDFDPFGDFDLLFGAAKLNLKIVEVPIHYRDRTYGSTQISRFRHGALLLRMCFIAMRKLKFI